ncbi:MAG: response regulator [Bacteroidota bacterium]
MENTDKSSLIYIVEDNEMFAETVKLGLENRDNARVELFYTGEKLLTHLENNDEVPDIVILDFFLNSTVADAKDGDKILIDFRKFYRDKGLIAPAVIMLTASKDINSAISLLKKGAKDYIIKDDSFFNNLTKSMGTIFELKKIKEESKMHKNKADKYKKSLIYSLSAAGIVVAVLIYLLLSNLL